MQGLIFFFGKIIGSIVTIASIDFIDSWVLMIVVMLSIDTIASIDSIGSILQLQEMFPFLNDDDCRIF